MPWHAPSLATLELSNMCYYGIPSDSRVVYLRGVIELLMRDDILTVQLREEKSVE